MLELRTRFVYQVVWALERVLLLPKTQFSPRLRVVWLRNASYDRGVSRTNQALSRQSLHSRWPVKHGGTWFHRRRPQAE